MEDFPVRKYRTPESVCEHEWVILIKETENFEGYASCKNCALNSYIHSGLFISTLTEEELQVLETMEE